MHDSLPSNGRINELSLKPFEVVPLPNLQVAVIWAIVNETKDHFIDVLFNI